MASRAGSFASPDQTEEKGCNNDDGDYDEDDLLPTDRAGLLFRDRFLLFLLLCHGLNSGEDDTTAGEGSSSGSSFPTEGFIFIVAQENRSLRWNAAVCIQRAFLLRCCYPLGCMHASQRRSGKPTERVLIATTHSSKRKRWGFVPNRAPRRAVFDSLDQLS